MSTPESRASDKVRLAASSLGVRLFRNNTGVLYDKNGTPVFFGLGNEPKKIEGKRLNQHFKFGDFIGATPVTITADMVGQTIAVFTNIEVKPEGKLLSTLGKAQRHPTSREGVQLKTINMVKGWGGIAGFATCDFDVQNIIAEFNARFKG